MPDITEGDNWTGMVIYPGEDIEAAMHLMGEILAAQGVKCPDGTLVNVCGKGEPCPDVECPAWGHND